VRIGAHDFRIIQSPQQEQAHVAATFGNPDAFLDGFDIERQFIVYSFQVTMLA
jgi:hypothetical protein